MSNEDDAASRKARADELRRARDERNAEIERGVEQGSPGKHVPDAEKENASPDEEQGNDDAPNYVDLINREMRRSKKEPEK